jgi:hypothetical protein
MVTIPKRQYPGFYPRPLDSAYLSDDNLSETQQQELHIKKLVGFIYDQRDLVSASLQLFDPLLSKELFNDRTARTKIDSDTLRYNQERLTDPVHKLLYNFAMADKSNKQHILRIGNDFI